MFISEDLPAPFSPSRACTSPHSAQNAGTSSATNPSKDFRIPASSSAARISLLRDHALDVPVHLPQVGVGKHLPGGHALLAFAVRKRTGVHVLALHDRVALGYHLADGFLRPSGAATGDVGAALGHRYERAVRARLPVAGHDLL